MRVLEYPDTKLGNFMKAKGISRNQLAISSGFSPQYIGIVVNGEMNPTIDRARRIANALYTTVDKIF